AYRASVWWESGGGGRRANPTPAPDAKEARVRARRGVPLRARPTDVSILHVTPLPRDRPQRRPAVRTVRQRWRHHHRARLDARRPDATLHGDGHFTRFAPPAGGRAG